MLIGYTDKMSDSELAELADWADHHAKEVPNPTWKRAYALIREGADLLLRRRALTRQDEAPKGEAVVLQKDSYPLVKTKSKATYKVTNGPVFYRGPGC